MAVVAVFCELVSANYPVKQENTGKSTKSPR